MNFDHYLRRIRYTGPLKPDIDTLCGLQEAHLFTVPFENIDIQSGIPIFLQPDCFYNKIVLKKRGGYCYEVNALFRELLTHIGFQVDYISARVIKGRNCGPEFDHLAMLVTIDGKQWLTDAGFGDFAFRPLPVATGQIQFDGRNHYVVREHELAGAPCLAACKWNSNKNSYIPEYCFTLQPRKLEEFEAMNYYQQTSPDSHFTQNLICSLPTRQGRISIINNRLILTRGSHRQETRIEPGAVRELLEQHFGVRVPEAEQSHTEQFSRIFSH